MKFCDGCARCFDDDASSCSGGCGTTLAVSRVGDTDLVAGYRLEYLLDSGVRGETYRATRLDCGRSCLIKIVHADDALAEEFLREAGVVQAMFHHGIAGIYEAGRLNDSEVFVVAEDPQAQSLRELIDTDGPPELRTTIRIARQAAEAVHALHTLGITHGAVNPSNIFIDTDHKGDLLVRIANIDVGGVVEHAVVSNKFLIDTALDSLRYFSPEQCRGEASTYKSDMYALGVVLYEMLSGSPPFDAANASGLIEQHLSVHPPEVKINNFDLRALLSHTLMEALQKQPSMRQSSADLFARQMRHIEQLATHVSTPAPVVTVRPAAPKTSRANIVTVPDVDLDLPPLAEARAEQPVFIPAFETEQPSKDIKRPAQPRLIKLQDSYTETLGPPVSEPDAAATKPSRLTPDKSRRKGLRERAAAFANVILEKATIKQPDAEFTKTIDFRAAREQIPVFTGKARESNAAPRSEPKVVLWAEPLDDIPSVDEAIKTLRSEGSSSKFTSAPEALIPEPVSSVPEVVPANLHAAIEPAKARVADALISAPETRANRIVVPWAQPVLQHTPRPVRAFEFSPTILGGVDRDVPPLTVDESGIFAAMEELTAPRFSRTRRVVFAGALATIAVMAFMLRGEIAGAFAPFDLATINPPAAQTPTMTTTTEVPVSNVPDIVSPAAQIEPEKAAPADEADRPKPIAISTSAAPQPVKQKPVEDEKRNTPPDRRKETQRPVTSAKPLVPSTLVITSGDSRKNKREAVPASGDRDPFAAPKSAVGLTRERIVKNPKP